MRKKIRSENENPEEQRGTHKGRIKEIKLMIIIAVRIMYQDFHQELSCGSISFHIR
jgi:hypothetical protein